MDAGRADIRKVKFMKRTIREWMPLATTILAVAVPLVLLGLKWHWIPFFFGYPLPVPVPS